MSRSRISQSSTVCPSLSIRLTISGLPLGTYELKETGPATDSNYCVGLLTANINSDLLDAKSWTKSPVPVLATDDDLGIYGPGHNCFTVAEDGETTVLVYHARTYKTIEGDPLNNPDRHTFIKNVKWSSDDTVILK